MAYDLRALVKQNDHPSIHFNTGTIFDLMTGVMVQGYDGEWYTNGGIGCLMYLYQGLTNSFKSTMLDSTVANLLAIYPDMLSAMFDTENHKLNAGLGSLDDALLTSRYDKIVKHIGPVSDRIIVSEKIFISELLSSLIEIKEARIKHKKDLTIETPFLNHKKERIRSMILLPVGIDSFSGLESPSEEDVMNKHALEDSKMNMIFMNDGRRKAIFSRALKGMASEAGMAFLCTGHTGDKPNLDGGPMARPKKEMQYMKAGQTIKGVGSSTTFGAQVVIETSSTLCRTADNKETRYPVDHEPDTNLNEVSLLFQKGKNNVSGCIFKFIVTQTHGLLSGLTNVEYTRDASTKGFNFSGGGNAFYSTCFTPETKSSRKTIRNQLDESYQLRRAYDLVAQIKFISENWDRSAIPVPIDDIDLNKACENLIAGKSTLVQDILNSRSYWTYKEDPRPYMSVYKVLDLLHKNM